MHWEPSAGGRRNCNYKEPTHDADCGDRSNDEEVQAADGDSQPVLGKEWQVAHGEYQPMLHHPGLDEVAKPTWGGPERTRRRAYVRSSRLHNIWRATKERTHDDGNRGESAPWAGVPGQGSDERSCIPEVEVPMTAEETV